MPRESRRCRGACETGPGLSEVRACRSVPAAREDRFPPGCRVSPVCAWLAATGRERGFVCLVRVARHSQIKKMSHPLWAPGEAAAPIEECGPYLCPCTR